MTFRGKIIILVIAMVALAVLPLSLYLIRQVETETNISLDKYRAGAYDLRREELHNLTVIGTQLAADYLQRRDAGELTDAEARQRFLGRLGALRYDGGQGYYWVHELDGRDGRPPAMVMHPTQPELVGMPVDAFVDLPRLETVWYRGHAVALASPAGQALGLRPVRLLAEGNRLAREQEGHAFIAYYWNKPTADTVSMTGYPKLSHVGIIPAWNWVVGCGLYVDDIERAIVVREAAIAERAQQTMRNAIGLMLLALAGCLLLGSWLAHRVTASVRELDGQARRIAAGDYASPVPVYGSDEFRGMREAFAKMLAAVDERERALRRTAEQLAAANRAKTDLIANVSHELRTPLVSVQGYCEMLYDGTLGPVTEQQQQKLAVCLRNLDVLHRHINDLLEFTRGEQSQHAAPARCDLVVLAQEAVETQQPHAAARGITIVRAGAEQAPLTGDARRLLQLLFNLLGNAVKFATPGSVVTVRVTAPAGQVELRVSNYGSSIPAAEREKIFERFYQTEQGLERRYAGMGLGLAIVREVAEEHGGSVRVADEPDGALSFIVVLPGDDTA